MNNTIKLVENGGIVPSPFERFVTEGIFDRVPEAERIEKSEIEKATEYLNWAIEHLSQVKSDAAISHDPYMTKTRLQAALKMVDAARNNLLNAMKTKE